MNAVNEKVALTHEQLDRITGLGLLLAGKLDKEVAMKQPIEERWLRNLRQYHGIYEADVMAKIVENGGSQAFVNMTRPKTNAGEAKLTEMLVPNDDRNFSVGDTAVPTNPGETPDAELAKQRAEQAKRMEDVVFDQLSESDYEVHQRDVIGDAAKLGTGIVKGPVVGENRVRSWQQTEAGFELVWSDDIRPMVYRVNPWDFYPDMRARRIGEAEHTFERKYLPKSELAEMRSRTGYLAEPIATLLAEGDARSFDHTEGHFNELRALSGLESAQPGDYELWFFNGMLDAADLVACGCEIEGYEQGEDAGLMLYATVEFIGDQVIRAYVQPLETAEQLYSVFCYEEDESSIFGFGVPHEMEDAQDVVNTAWRMLLDNAGLSVGPQTVLDITGISPADGSDDYTLRPRKAWIKKDKSVPIQNVFATFTVDSHQPELANIIQMASALVDEETGMPKLQEGQMGGAPDTLGGMSMLMNASNAQIRRIVKRFDDDCTKPTIGRFYDWNMLFNEDETIKGDYKVDARGSSTLLVKETQQQGLMQMINLAATPGLAPMHKMGEIVRKAWQSFHIPADEVVHSDEEIAANMEQLQQAQQQGGEGGDPNQVRLRIAQMNSQDKAQDRQLKYQLAMMEQQQEVMALAQAKDMTLEQMKARLGEISLNHRSKLTLMAGEARAEQNPQVNL